jgi:uracil-DNA glycosylase
MREHGLANVYITNLVKCRVSKVGEPLDLSWNDACIVEHCIKTYLLRELEGHEPVVVFCFGHQVHKVAVDLKRRLGAAWHAEYLIHPSYIANFAQTKGRTPAQLVSENDDLVRGALRNSGLGETTA